MCESKTERERARERESERAREKPSVAYERRFGYLVLQLEDEVSVVGLALPLVDVFVQFLN
jgi:hypothetical protein